jgi:hypothetical protein
LLQAGVFVPDEHFHSILTITLAYSYITAVKSFITFGPGERAEKSSDQNETELDMELLRSRRQQPDGHVFDLQQGHQDSGQQHLHLELPPQGVDAIKQRR